MGKWISRILEPDTDSSSGTTRHISPENLARLADGRVTPEERRQYIQHVNCCPACYEILQETLTDLSSDRSRKGKSSLMPRWFAYALAASFLVAAFIGTGLFYKYHMVQPRILTTSLVLDADLRAILSEDESLIWKGAKVAQLTALLQDRGIQAGSIRKVILKSPYVATKDLTQLLFAPREVLRIRIQGETAYLEVCPNPDSQ